MCRFVDDHRLPVTISSTLYLLFAFLLTIVLAASLTFVLLLQSLLLRFAIIVVVVSCWPHSCPSRGGVMSCYGLL